MEIIPEDIHMMDTIPEEEKLLEDGEDLAEETSEIRKGFTVKAISLEDMEPMKKIIVKIELNGKLVGKSEEICVQDKEAFLSWETFFEVTEMTESLLDELITHPLVCKNTQFIDSLLLLYKKEEPAEPPKAEVKGKKEKKKGSKAPSEKDKSVKDQSVSEAGSKKTKKGIPVASKSISSTSEAFPVLGVGNMDMMPLIFGEEEIEELILLNPTTEQKGSEAIAWGNLPKLRVSVHTTGDFLDDVSENVSNVLSITLESLQNVNHDWNEDVEVATILPNNQVIKFKKGNLLLDDSVWVSKRKKWFGLVDIAGQGALSSFKVPDNVNTLYNPMEHQVTDVSLSEKPRILWNQLHRSILNVASQEFFKDKIMGYNCWPVEILIPSSSGKSEGKKKGEKVSDSKVNHFITFLDISRLIYPGEKTIRLTSQLFPYSQETMKLKFGSVHVLFDEIPISSDNSDVHDSKSKTTQSKKDGKAGSTKSKKSSLKSKDGKKEKIEKVEEIIENEPEEPKEPEPVLNENEEPIFIIVEIGLQRPLIEKRDEEKVLESIYKLIPKREELTPQQLETVNATKTYEECIQRLIHSIHDEYQIFYNVNETFKNSCKNFLMHLHVRGAYSKMVETMKEAISAHVRDAVGPPENWGRMRSECQDVLTNLYQDMTKKMYTIVSSYPDPSLQKYDPEITCDDLYLFEAEAVEEDDYEKARYYLLQMLERTEKANPQVWVDLAGYWKMRLEFEKAEECAKEAISLDARYINALLFHGLLSWLLEDFDVAEMFLLAAVSFHPSCMVGWVTVHMLHKQMGKQQEARVELLNAKGCLPVSDDDDDTESTAKGKCQLTWCPEMAEPDRVFLVTAVKLLTLSFPEFAELALSYDLLLHGRTMQYLYYLAVCHYQQGRYADSLSHLDEALKLHWEDDRLWALKGHNFYKLERQEEAKEAYGVALNFKDEEDNHLIYLRLGNILLREGDLQGAKDSYLHVCRDSPSPLSWLGVGVSAFVEDDLETAELALSEANMLDCRIGRVWGYLALVNLMLDRPAVFNKCILQAVKFGFEDEVLMERIDSLVKMVQPITY